MSADHPEASPPPELSILVCTFRRPEFLGALLAGLEAQHGGPRRELVVVDNDPEGSARAVVAASSARYLVEPRPGVSWARNRAVAAARAPVVLFLDDDQLVADDFLARLWVGWQRRPAHQRGLRLGLAARLEHGVTPDARHQRTLARFAAPDYVPVERGAFGTGGFIVERALLAALPFATELTAGEDTDVFLRASERGYHFGHLASVTVEERVTAPRAGLGYSLARQRQAGRLDEALDRRARERGAEATTRELREHIYPILAAGRALVRLPAAVLRGEPAVALHLQSLAYIAGRLEAKLKR